MKPSTKAVFDVLSDGKWVTNYGLIELSGQTDALRRLRELRAEGWQIEKRRRELSSGKLSNTWEYRLKPVNVMFAFKPKQEQERLF